MNKKYTYYDILGVNKEATQEILDENFKKLVNTSNKDLKLLAKAYYTLSNQNSRDMYDNKLEQYKKYKLEKYKPLPLMFENSILPFKNVFDNMNNFIHNIENNLSEKDKKNIYSKSISSKFINNNGKISGEKIEKELKDGKIHKKISIYDDNKKKLIPIDNK
jgi:curved DNA-binding protein CbpA